MFRKLRWTIIVASLLFLLDVLTGQLLILMFATVLGPPIFLFKLFLRWGDRERRNLLLARAGIYFAMVALIGAAFLTIHTLAIKRAEPIIAACERYRAQKGTYPQELSQLVPAYLPHIPLAKPLVLVTNHYWYVSRPNDHRLAFASVGMVTYDYRFELKKWQQVDY